MTFRNVSSTPPISFQPLRAKRRRRHIFRREKKEEKKMRALAYNTRGIVRICPLSAAALLQFIRIRPFVCMYLKKRGTETLSAVPRALSLYRANSPILQSLPLPSLVAREVERPFEICRWPKDASRTVLVWPRIRDSYLLTESPRKEGLIERPYHLRTSSAAIASYRVPL